MLQRLYMEPSRSAVNSSRALARLPVASGLEASFPKEGRLAPENPMTQTS